MYSTGGAYSGIAPTRLRSTGTENIIGRIYIYAVILNKAVGCSWYIFNISGTVKGAIYIAGSVQPRNYARPVRVNAVADCVVCGELVSYDLALRFDLPHHAQYADQFD